MNLCPHCGKGKLAVNRGAPTDVYSCGHEITHGRVRNWCVHLMCWYPACAAPIEIGGYPDCCQDQSCENPTCPEAEFNWSSMIHEEYGLWI